MEAFAHPFRCPWRLSPLTYTLKMVLKRPFIGDITKPLNILQVFRETEHSKSVELYSKDGLEKTVHF